MKLFTPLIAVPMLSLGLLACISNPNPEQPDINKENRLVAAGFKMHGLKSEAQISDFRQMPAHMIRPATYKGRQVYVYADPTICGCLYVGSKTAYNTYINGAQDRYVQQQYNSATRDDGYSPSPWMLDGGPWDDAWMYGMYLD